ncbi:TfoX/Sxy family protein [Dietzia cinnamea]|uniref:TfoX/Sxy family protein n=1 Tax=Dietzia cinnamea TaxID=321318 RepID=UPI0021A5FA8B|nr:TfoX/Sxy family protein [Dietzia cinnamea]MCT1638908.1 TfoX/Sxy family protein [Dietzia cinnamea]
MPRTPVPAAQQELIDRLREHLADAPVSREVSMFGGRCFMVSGKIVVSAGRDGGLLVRVDPDRHAELLSRPGAAQAEMGAGRDMGPGWITVAADAIADDEALSTWLTAALRYNRAVTGGGDG